LYYVYTDKDGKEHRIPFNVEKGEGYKEFYANAAAGGFAANYHFRIDFYSDVVPAVEYTDAEGRGSPADSDLHKGITRQVVASAKVSLPFLKELADWLSKVVKVHEDKYGPIQMPITQAPNGKRQEEEPK